MRIVCLRGEKLNLFVDGGGSPVSLTSTFFMYTKRGRDTLVNCMTIKQVNDGQGAVIL